MLVAAIEVHPRDVQWEPLERKVPLGDGPDDSQLRWTISDDSGRLVDFSTNLQGWQWPESPQDWQLMSCEMVAGRFDPILVNPRVPAKPSAEDKAMPTDRSATARRFIITVGQLREPQRAELRLLVLSAAAVSLVVWLSALVWSRWLCRRALRPVRAMADAARFLQGSPQSEALLTVSPNRDELSDLGRAFNGLLDSLRDAAEQQRRFAGDASHQLRTPLAATLTAVEFALRNPRPVEEYQRILSIVRRRGRELAKIVDTLLSLARHVGTGEFEGFELVELNQFCRDHLAAWHDRDRWADMELQPALTPVFVRSHPVLVGQVLDNLLDNAAKYSPPGSPIVLRVEATAREATIAVVDRGPGIAAQELGQIFDPFFRSDLARWDGKPGEGLGLAISRRFALLAGGRLEVDSQPGSGSEFRLVLPRVPQSEHEPRELAASPAADYSSIRTERR